MKPAATQERNMPIGQMETRNRGFAAIQQSFSLKHNTTRREPHLRDLLSGRVSYSHRIRLPGLIHDKN